jgi:hypothetical protein
MAEGFISDPETDKIVAILRGGVVYRFHNDTEGRRLPPSLAPVCMILTAIWLATCMVSK